MVLDESQPLIWASILSWFTPTVLFVILNLVIGTIVITSSTLRRPQQHHHHDDGAHKLPRATSSTFVLDRLRSLSLYRHHSGEIPLDASTPPPAPPPGAQNTSSGFVLERLRSLGLYRHPSGETPLESFSTAPAPAESRPTILDRLRSINLSRLRSGEFPIESAAPPAAAAEDGDELEHPHFGRSRSDTGPAGPEKVEKVRKTNSEKLAAMGSGRRGAAAEAEEVGVDAKADDFINRFREQLRLQRLDSIMSYSDMLNRGK